MPIAIGALASIAVPAIAGIAGDAMSASSAADTNATSMAIAEMNNQTSNAQFQQSMQFNSAQAAAARDFAAQQQQQVEQYDTQMSDTAMQRRVQDLKDAGINPLLAISQGGASAPMAPAVTSASQASAPGIPGKQQPNLTPPGGAFGQLGSQINNALQNAQLSATIDNIKAQTAKTEAQTGTEIPANVGYLKSMTGLTDQNAEIASSGAQEAAARLKQDTGPAGNIALDWVKNWTATGAASTNLDILRATKDALVSATQSDATAKSLGLQALRNMNEVQQGKFGQVLAYINAILQPASSAAGTAAKIGAIIQ